jgi:hypothetical protein
MSHLSTHVVATTSSATHDLIASCDVNPTSSKGAVNLLRHSHVDRMCKELVGAESERSMTYDHQN